MKVLSEWYVKRSGKINYRIALFGLLLLFLAVFAQADQQELSTHFFNSDTLYQPSLYRDLFEQSNKLSDWRLNPAPNFFPDMALYSGLMFVTGSDIQWSSFLFSFIQLAVLCFLFLKLFRHLTNDAYEITTVAIVLLFLFPLVFLIDGDFLFTFYILSNSYHLGSFVLALASLYFFFRLSQNADKKHWVGYCFVIALGVASDKLFITNFIAPVCIVSVYSLFFQQLRKRTIVLLSATLLAGFFGWFVVNFLHINHFIEIETPHSFMNVENILPSFQLFLKVMGESMQSSWLITLISLSSALSLLLLSTRAVQALFKRNPTDFVFILLAAIAICTLLAPILAGNFTGPDTLRYNYHAFIFLLALLPYTLYQSSFIRRIPKKWNYLLPVFTILITCSIVIRTDFSGGLRNYFSFYPEVARKADVFSRKTGIREGTADYWKAKVITQFSKEGVVAVPTFENLLPWDHATSKNLFHEHPVTGQKMTFRFTLFQDSITSSRLQEVFGDSIPLKKVRVDDLEFLVHPEYSYERQTYSIRK